MVPVSQRQVLTMIAKAILTLPQPIQRQHHDNIMGMNWYSPYSTPVWV